jgi:hypothetical protein
VEHFIEDLANMNQRLQSQGFERIESMAVDRGLYWTLRDAYSHVVDRKVTVIGEYLEMFGTKIRVRHYGQNSAKPFSDTTIPDHSHDKEANSR